MYVDSRAKCENKPEHNATVHVSQCAIVGYNVYELLQYNQLSLVTFSHQDSSICITVVF